MSNIDKQALKPVGKFAFESVGARWHHVKHGEAQITLPKLPLMRLYAEDDVQALLDELEAKETEAEWMRKRIEELAKAREVSEEERVKWFQMAQKKGDDLDAAEKRIAELEARDKPKFVQCWSCKHDIEILAIVDCDGYCPRCAAPIDLDDEPCAGTAKGE